MVLPVIDRHQPINTAVEPSTTIAHFKVVAFAASSGGIQALQEILNALPEDFPAAIVIVQHRGTQLPNLLPDVLGFGTALPIRQATEGSLLRPGTIVVAPPGLHLLVGEGGVISLSDGPKVNWLRPSADPLFESLAESFGSDVIAVVLTGGDSDGSVGVSVVKGKGGTVIVQDPATAAVQGMPLSAIETGSVDLILPLNQIADRLRNLVAARSTS